MWIAVCGNDNNETVEQRAALLKADISPKAFDLEEEKDDDIVRFAYRMKEASEEKAPPTFYCFAVGQKGHVQVAMYFDKEKDIHTARKTWRTIKEI